MKFHANLQSFGIPNLTAYEATYAEILKLCQLDPNSTVFLHYYSDLGELLQSTDELESLSMPSSGILPLIAAQDVDQSYGLDPSRFAIQTAMKTQKKYRRFSPLHFLLSERRVIC